MKYLPWLSLFLFAPLGCLIPITAKAQVTPDGTTLTTVNQDGNNFLINQGDRVGDNLFHSFDEFSVPTLGSAAFNNRLDIANIFSRVTGSNISNIDGLISANGAANLFLINPNGIIFGQNARLDLGGSFFASTADSLLFEGNTEFSASNPQAPPLLEVSIPIGLNFRDNPGDITIEQQPSGSADFDPAPSFDDNLFGLRVPDGKTFALAGGDITADGGGIVSVGGRIELGAVGEGGTLGLNIDGDSISFNFSNDLLRANVSLTNNAGFLVSGGGGGDLVINADNINIFEGSGLFGGIFNELGSANSQAGNITINATDSLTINSGGSIQNNANIGTLGNAGDINLSASSLSLVNLALIITETFSSGSAGDLTIDTENLSVSNGAFVSTATRPNSSGQGGNLTVNAAELIELTGTSASEQSSSGLYSTTLGTGDAGDLTINTPRLIVRDGAAVETSTSNQGQGGNLTVNVPNSIELNGTSVNGQLFSRLTSEVFGSESAGDLTIDTGNLSVSNGAFVSTATRPNSSGQGGNLTVNAAELIELTGTSANEQSSSGLYSTTLGTGDAGDLTINTPRLIVRDGAAVETSTSNQGQGGNLTVNVPNSIELSGTSVNGQLFSRLTSEVFGSGIAGDIKINTQQLQVQRARISTSALGAGNAGGIFVEASDSVNIVDEGILSAASSAISLEGNLAIGTGSGGNITIETGQLNLQNGSGVLTSTIGQGDAGSLTIDIIDSVNLDANSILATASVGGSGGDMSISTRNLSAQNNSSIATVVAGQGNPGDLAIEAKDSVNIFSDSVVSTSSLGIGTGGSISIDTKRLTVSDNAAVSTSTFDPNTFDPNNFNLSGFNSDNLALLINVIAPVADGDFEQGNSGNLELNSTETVNLADGGVVTTSGNGRASGGTLSVDTDRLLVTEGASIRTSTVSNSSGRGGDLTITASESTELIGTSADEQLSSGLTSATLGTGDAGDLVITTPQLIIEDGAAIVTDTSNQGQAGNLTINATEFVKLNGASANGQLFSRLTSETFNTGNAGTLNIDTKHLLVTDGAFISSATRSVGRAGAIAINTTKAVDLTGNGGLFVTATNSGTAGNLNLEAGELNIADGASVTVSSPQGQAGNLNIIANSLSQNQGQITAETGISVGNVGANINLEISDIWRIENESLVSATALGDADGGNININDGLSNTELILLAFPPTGNNGSDIIANAEQGNGGRIDITAAGVFGIEFRDEQTPLNDFTVTSEFGQSGETIINRTVEDPTSGLIELPQAVGDASDQISQNPCEQGVGSEFIVTGKGGLPPNVNEALNSEDAQVGLIEAVPSEQQKVEANIPSENPSSEVVPAQGWVFNDKGEVTLTAYSTSEQEIQRSGQKHHSNCSSGITP